MKALQPHQQRVVAEKAELDDRLDKLGIFIGSDLFNKLPESEKELLYRQHVAMQGYSEILETRIHGFSGTSRYRCHKEVLARPMSRAEYNSLRGWEVPEDENPSDEGYLVEYVDGGQANHPDFKGYISWSPKDVFERGYRKLSA